MSQNDHTGFKSYSVDDLINEVYSTHDTLVHRPIEMEIAKRLEHLADAQVQLDKLDDDFTVEDFNRLADAVIDCTNTTVHLLEVLADFSIENSDELRSLLKAAAEISKLNIGEAA